MKQFLETNTITYNLISFTAFKSMLVFTALIDGPKSYKDLQEIFENHEYLKEIPSIDTLRIYLNSLKEFGCDIEKIQSDGVIKFSVKSHPFCLNFTNKQIKQILKIYKVISKSINVEDLRYLQHFFGKLSLHVSDEELKAKMQNLSPFNNIDDKLIDDLMKYAQNNTEVVLLYNSPNSGKKNITLVIDNLKIRNNKLYVYGYNSKYKYSTLLVSKIIKIVSVNIKNKTIETPKITVGYKYKKSLGEIPELIDGEKTIKSGNNEDIIEICSRNKFEIMQRIMSLGSKCTVLYPDDFKMSVIENLKKMKEGYVE